MDDVIVPRQKTGKEYTSLDRKEGGLRHVGKSMSSRTTDAGSSSGKDSQAKMLPSKIYHSQEGKSSKQLKDRSTEANASASSTDQKLTSRSNLSASYANNSRDLKGLQSDGRRGSLTKQVSNLNRYHDSVASGMIPITSSINWYFFFFFLSTNWYFYYFIFDSSRVFFF